MLAGFLSLSVSVIPGSLCVTMQVTLPVCGMLIQGEEIYTNNPICIKNRWEISAGVPKESFDLTVCP